VRFGQVQRLLDGCPRRAWIVQVLAGERVQQVGLDHVAEGARKH
jgi:hypothetical protein